MAGVASFLIELFPANSPRRHHSVDCPTCGDGITQLHSVFIEHHLIDSRKMQYDAAKYVDRAAA
jgi:hypothetical protein